MIHMDLNKQRLLTLKQAKLKSLETELQYQTKKKADSKTIHQLMRKISKTRSEINNLK